MTQGIEWQVSNLELSKKLKELGVKQESLFCYYVMKNDADKLEIGKPYVDMKYCIDTHYDPDGTSYYHPFELASAFTVAELGEMLPDEDEPRVQMYLHWGPKPREYGLSYDYEWNKKGFVVEDTNEANARAKMLCWLIENGKVK